MSKRATSLVSLLERLIKQEHLYTGEQLREMKSQLRIVKKQIADVQKQSSKGFGKYEAS